MAIEDLPLLSGLFALFGAIFGSAASIVTMIVQQHFRMKIERIRLHEAELLEANKELYRFIGYAQDCLLIPSNPRQDFIDLMKRYFKDVKPHKLLFASDIRYLLGEFECQYDCLGNPDLHPTIPFDDFIRKRSMDVLNQLEKVVEKRTDVILHP